MVALLLFLNPFGGLLENIAFMQQLLHSTKRAVSVAVAAATIAFTVGLAGLVAPSRVAAASAGDLIKGSLSTVYYYGYDGMRYTFPNEKTYFTWYSDFSDVTTISDSSLADLELAGNIVYRAGSKFIKITSDPKVYAVATNGAIHWIESADVAVDYAGSDWASTNVQDVPDAFFADYTTGASLMTATAFNGAMYMDGGSYYIAVDGEKRLVTSAGRSANGMQTAFFMDGTGMDDSALTAGTDITTAITGLNDAAQTESIGSDVTGAVTLAISSSTPAGATLPQGANSVEVLTFKATAGSAAASLDSVAFTQSGAGSTSDVSNVYIYEGNTRLTESRSVNASTRMVTFSNLNLDIAANSTRTFTLRITTSATAVAADVMSFGIASSTSATASGSIGGSFPISGNSFSISGADAGTVTVTKSGTITNPTVGSVDAVIGQFKIAAASEAASVETLTLKIDNASDHSNFKLWDGSVELVAGVNTSGDVVVFDMSSAPFAIVDGSSNTFSVSATIGGQSAELVKVYIDNAVDVVAIGGDYGFGMTADIGTSGTYDGDTCSSTSAMTGCSLSTIQGGDLTLTMTGPTTGDIRTNSQDQTLLAFTMTSSQVLTIKDLDIIVYGDDDATPDGDATDAGDDSTDDTTGLINTGAEGNLKDIKIINADTGAVLMGPLELDCVTLVCGADGTNDASQTIDFTDDFSMDAGDVLHLAVTADVDNGVNNPTAFAALINIEQAVSPVTEDENGDALAASVIVPSGDITGYNQTARAASMVVSLASTPGDVTTVQGTSDVLVQAFNLVAGQGGEVNISEVAISVFSDDNNSTFTYGDQTPPDVNTYITSCYLKDGTGAAVGVAKSPTSDGKTLTFNSLDWTVAASASAQLKLYCNFSNPSATTTYYFAFDITTPASDIVAEDSDSVDVDPTGSAVNGGTTPTNVVSLVNAGSLAATAGASTPQADLLLTSSSLNHVATYRYTATNEAFEIQTVDFTEEQAEDDLAVTDSVGYANDISLVTITYPLVDGTTGTSSVAMTGNAAKFTGLHAYVAVNTPSDIKVYVNVPSTDRDSGGSATSNEKVRMGWYVGATPDGSYFKAVGVGSGTTFTDTDSDGSGTNYTGIGDDAFATDGIATFVVRETKPTFSISSASPSGSSSPTLNEVLRFNVAASSNEDVILESLLFKVSTQDIAASNWNDCDTNATTSIHIDDSELEFYNVTKSTSTQLDTTDTNWLLYTAAAVVCTDSTSANVPLGYAKLTLPVAEVIPAGSSYTYVLKLDSEGASTSSDDTLRVDIVSEPATTFLTTTTNNSNEALSISDTDFAVDAVTDFYLGDIICLTDDDSACASTDERALVVACTGASATNGGVCASGNLTIVRGYLGSVQTATEIATDEVDRIPGSMMWQDDGSTAAGTTTQTRWGAYLVDTLNITGGLFTF
jgi:hypothetical protein